MIKRIAVIGGIVVAVCGTAFAAETSSTSLSVLDSIAFKYWGQYQGPGVSSGPFQTAKADGSFKGQNLDGYFTTGYRPNKTDIIGVGIPMKFAFTDAAPGVYNGMAYSLEDPWLDLQRVNFVNRGPLKMFAELRVYTPVSSYSTNNMITGARFNQLTTYDIPNSRFQLGAWTWFRHNVFAARGFSGSAGYDWGINVSPFVNYQLTGKLAATVWTDIVQFHNVQGQAYFASATNELMDIQPGLSWDVLPHLNLNPFINIFPQNPTISNTTVNLNISATFL